MAQPCSRRKGEVSGSEAVWRVDVYVRRGRVEEEGCEYDVCTVGNEGV